MWLWSCGVELDLVAAYRHPIAPAPQWLTTKDLISVSRVALLGSAHPVFLTPQVLFWG